MWQMLTAIGLTAGASGLGAMTQHLQGKLSRLSAQSAAASAAFEGEMAALAYRQAAYDHMEDMVRMRSSQVVQGAAAGIALDSQSFHLIQRETQQNFLNDARKLFNQAEITELMGQANARSLRLQGRVAARMSDIGAFGTLLGGAARSFQMYTNFGFGGAAGGYGGSG